MFVAGEGRFFCLFLFFSVISPHPICIKCGIRDQVAFGRDSAVCPKSSPPGPGAQGILAVYFVFQTQKRFTPLKIFIDFHKIHQAEHFQVFLEKLLHFAFGLCFKKDLFLLVRAAPLIQCTLHPSY